MAASAGYNCLVKVSTTTIGFTDNFSYAVNMGNEETTTFGDTWKANIPTIRDVSLSISGSYDKSDSGQDTAIWTEILTGDGAIAEMRVYVSNTNYYSGAAVLTSCSIDSTAQGKISYSASFVGNGTWSYT